MKKLSFSHFREMERKTKSRQESPEAGTSRNRKRKYMSSSHTGKKLRKSEEGYDSVLQRKISSKDDSQKETVSSTKTTGDLLTSRTGGAYIPPAKLRMMQAQITDKSSAAYQRIAWEALKKSIHGHINKVNTGNIGIIVRELLKENIVRGRGLLCRSMIQAQAASVTFTHVYAALVAVINSKVRLVEQFVQCELDLEESLQNLSYVHIFMFEF